MHRPSLEKVDDTVMVELADDLKHGEQLVDSRPDILQSLSQDDMARLEKKLVRKLDIRLLPILILLFILNILDRNAIANARLGGLEEDLGLTQKQYQTAVMAVWAGYISMMIPSNMLLSVIKPRIYLPVCVAVWGLVAGASGFTQNFAGIVVVRFLTGVTEAPYFVGCIFLLSCWYKRNELPVRISIFYSGYTLSSAFGGLIAAGIIGNMDGVGGYASWRWLFLIEGAVTVICAVPAYWILPNYPATTKWLSEQERALAVWRLSIEADGEEDTVQGSVWKGLKEACSDLKVWLLVIIQTGAVMGMSFTYFFPSIVATLGYPRVETLLLTAPPYFAAFIFAIANSWHSGKTLERGWHITIACCIGIVGQITAMSTTVIGARYFAFFLCAMGAFSAFQVILSWVSSTIPRPKAKRAVAIAMATAISNGVGNIPTAYLYPTENAP
ncbi:hypothetical protein OHC33_010348 [Knufia fluminis]|uniref:Major facilitator superfamily (MFS) profile domain-containing protein n=1 Tax=Knufia fluminis TaxID=191047 RepID=A0AAN8I2F4_9EURO|nr:hypothetical protein OHC33_010348 [Knufia fluminis]